MDSRCVTIGWSNLRNTRKAVAQVLEPFRSLRGQLGLALVYASVRHDLKMMLSEMRNALGNLPLIGCTTTGEFCTRGHSMGGMVLGGISSEILTASTGYGRNVYQDPRAAGRQAASMAVEHLGNPDESKPRNRVCLMHTAGFTLAENSVEEEVLAGIQDVLEGEWTIVGGSAGDECRFLRNHQLVGDAVFDDAVVLTLVTTDAPIAHQMTHGYLPTDVSCQVTRSEDRVVQQIDGRLALDVYSDLLSVPRAKMTQGMSLVRLTDKLPKLVLSLSQSFGLTPQRIMDNIPFYTHAIEHPFGIKAPDGSVVIKAPRSISAEGFLEFYHRVPEGQQLFLMNLDRELTLSATPRAIARVTEDLGRDPDLCLIYECSGRFIYLSADVQPLFQRIKASTASEFLGFFSGGEQGTMEGQGCQTHSYAVSVLGFGGGAAC